MRCLAALPCACALLVAACGGDRRSDADAGPPRDAGPRSDGGSAACDEPDRACPVELPYPSGACEGALSCPYTEGGVGWTYTCESGRWRATATDCPPGCAAVPPLKEECAPSFAGTLTGATVELGPPSETEPFRPFTPGELVELVWGGQGSPMLAFRLRVSGVEAPDCVLAATTLSEPSTMERGATDRGRVTLHCGETLATFAIVPFTGVDCDERIFDVHVEVVVEGVGTGTADVTFMGGQACYG